MSKETLPASSLKIQWCLFIDCPYGDGHDYNCGITHYIRGFFPNSREAVAKELWQKVKDDPEFLRQLCSNHLSGE